MSAGTAGKPLRFGLWAAQALVFAAFVLFGCMKLFMPVESLAGMWIWPGEVPVAFLRTMGVIDVAGGVGILVPALTRILPRLTVWAALGCVALQLSAIAFHGLRGEFIALPLNFILLALCVFVLWGRTKKATIA